MSGNMFYPDYTAATGLLSHLNSDELKELLNDDKKLEIMIKDLQQVKNIEAEKEMMLTSNKSIAEYNLSQKPILEDGRVMITQLYLRASDLKSDVLAKKKKLESKKSQSSLDSILAIMQAKTAEIEEVAELQVEKMLAEQMTVDEFLNLYLKTKTEAHIFHTKVEKLQGILHHPSQPQLKAAPTRARRASRPPPPPPPLVTAIETPQNPISIPKPTYPALPNMNSKVSNKISVSDNRVIVPTRIAPKPPNPQVPLRRQKTSALNAFDIYSSHRVPVLPPPSHQQPVPKKC